MLSTSRVWEPAAAARGIPPRPYRDAGSHGADGGTGWKEASAAGGEAGASEPVSGGSGRPSEATRAWTLDVVSPPLSLCSPAWPPVADSLRGSGVWATRAPGPSRGCSSRGPCPPQRCSSPHGLAAALSHPPLPVVLDSVAQAAVRLVTQSKKRLPSSVPLCQLEASRGVQPALPQGVRLHLGPRCVPWRTPCRLAPGLGRGVGRGRRRRGRWAALSGRGSGTERAAQGAGGAGLRAQWLGGHFPGGLPACRPILRPLEAEVGVSVRPGRAR